MEALRNLLQCRRQGREVGGDFLHDAGGLPQENSGVPVVVATVDIVGGHSQRGFLHKPGYRMGWALAWSWPTRLPLLNIAVAGGWVRRDYAEGHEKPLVGPTQRLTHERGKVVLALNPVICWKYQHGRFRVDLL